MQSIPVSRRPRRSISDVGRRLRPPVAAHSHGMLMPKKCQGSAARGRHDPCVVPRAVPIVEAMAALVLVDHWMRQHAQNELFKF